MGKLCPLIKEDCVEHRCHFYIHLLGENPQSGVMEDKWGCAVSWLPILLIENANQVRKAASSVDKVANVTAEQTAVMVGAMTPEARDRLRMAEPKLLAGAPSPNGHT